MYLTSISNDAMSSVRKLTVKQLPSYKNHRLRRCSQCLFIFLLSVIYIYYTKNTQIQTQLWWFTFAEIFTPTNV